MDLIVLVLLLVVVGFCVWALTTYVPMPPGWARAIQVIALIVCILFLLTRIVAVPNVLPHR